MAVLELNALSTTLCGSFSATVLFPDEPTMQDKTYASLYFLHDVGGNDTDIRTIKNLNSLVNELGLFIICPSVMHSFGMDLPLGGKYSEFMNRELPGICRHLFPLDETRQFVGGVGIGAYGAYWNAANHPDVFQKCMLVNGRYDMAALCEKVDSGAEVCRLTKPNLEAIFGNLQGVRHSPYDLLWAESSLAKEAFVGWEKDSVAAADSLNFAKRLQRAAYIGESEEDVYETGLRWLIGG
jgi:S-formylglutathione hydrolase FrmB